MLKRYQKILGACWRTFGLKKDFIVWLTIIPLFGLFTRITLALDNLFFPHYKQAEVKQPIFIIGHPRSGTTFLHNLLTQTDDFVTFDTWHMFFLALSARKLLTPLIENAIKKGKAVLIPEETGHKVVLDQPEEEEFIFIHTLDTPLLSVMTPLAFEEPIDYFYDRQPAVKRHHSVQFFKRCLQRQITYTGKKRVIAKPNYSVYRLQTLMEAFPDAKFIYLVRSPYETLASYFSLHRNMFEQQWGLANLSDEMLQQYFNRKYVQSLNLYRYFYDLQKNPEFSSDQVMVLRSDDLYKHPERTFNKIVDFTDIKPTQSLRESVAKTDQSVYKRKHSVRSLHDFGLTPEKVSQDFSFVFEAYGFDKSATGMAERRIVSSLNLAENA
ncbi:MAG: sulfotransferase [Phormidesmis sp.]